jgi:biopolymer transport protein ExbD
MAFIAKRRAGPAAYSIRSEINVTPLVDVCLVLLIIFMVVTPLLQEGVAVALPETTNPAKMPESENQLDVAVKADGSVFLGQRFVPPTAIVAELSDMYRTSPNKSVVVKADASLKYKQVRDVMRKINEAGFRGVGLITRKIDTGEGGG